MPQVQRLKKKIIDKGSKADNESDGSLYLKFEEENPSLSKFVENSDSVLDIKSNNGGDTIIREKEISLGVYKKEISNNYQKSLIREEKNFEKIDSGSFKQSLETGPCIVCRKEKCKIQ